MSIVNYQDLVGTFRAIGKSGWTAEEVNSYHIPQCQAEIEGLLATVYTVPFSSNNVTAKDLVTQLVYCRLSGGSMEERQACRNEVLDRVEKLKSGKELMLTSSGPIDSGITNIIWSNTKDYDNPTTVDDPIRWNVDSNQIDDIRDAREL